MRSIMRASTLSTAAAAAAAVPHSLSVSPAAATMTMTRWVQECREVQAEMREEASHFKRQA
jgi:hypothetical protein